MVKLEDKIGEHIHDLKQDTKKTNLKGKYR